MSLTTKQINNAKSKTKRYKLHDGKGLFLIVRTSGVKNWSFNYRVFGKEKSLSLGEYPEVSLKEASIRRLEAARQIDKGNDPSVEKQLAQAKGELGELSRFKSVTEDWLKRRGGKWTKKYQSDVWTRLSNHVFPYLGEKPIQLIKPQELLVVIRKLEEQGKIDMANRCLQISGQVFRYGIALGIVERDISQDLRGAITTRKAKHNPILKEAEIPDFMERLEKYDGHALTKYAVEALMLTMVRTKELRGMEWTEVNFDKAEWRIPAERMKVGTQDHIVPLSKRMIQILIWVHQLELSDKYVFPNQNNPYDVMSANTILYALYRMGYHGRLTAHGFRGTASTILNENGFNADWIERQLAHCERNSVRAAYNHAQYLPERRDMMNWWSDFLEDKKIKTVNFNGNISNFLKPSQENQLIEFRP